MLFSPEFPDQSLSVPTKYTTSREIKEQRECCTEDFQNRKSYTKRKSFKEYTLFTLLRAH